MSDDPLAGLAPPPGAPGALRSAAADHVAAGGGLSGAAGSLRAALSGTLADWSGPASLAAASAATTLAAAQVRAGQASEQVGAALTTYATLLEQAQASFVRARALADQALQDEAAHRADAARELSVAGPLADPFTALRLSAAAGGSDGFSSPLRALARTTAEAALQDVRQAAQQAAGQVSAATASISPPPAPSAAPAREPEHHWYDGALHQVKGVGTGLWDGVAQPVAMVGGLVGLDGDVSDNWSSLGGGLWHGVTHPVDFGKALIDWKDLASGEYGHWAGELAPSVAAAFFTGGAAAGAKGAEGLTALAGGERAAVATDRLAQGGAGAERAAARSYEFDMVNNPGPLADDWLPGDPPPPAATFAGGKYDVDVRDSDRVLYRAGDSTGNGLGQFFTETPPQSVASVRIDSAVRPQWLDAEGGWQGASPIDSVFEVKVPAGTETFVGPVANQGGVHVGGQGMEQVFIRKPWLIDGVEVLSRRPLP